MNDFKGKLTTTTAAKEFILAGNAIISIKNTKTNNHFSFKVKKSDKKNDISPRFVSLLTGPDNSDWGSWTYMGMIFDKSLKTFTRTNKSRISADATSYKAFKWLTQWLESNSELPKTVEIWHEGRCGACGRKLTVPESIERGLGPECSGEGYKTKKKTVKEYNQMPKQNSSVGFQMV
jgi:hypothetical protein